MKKLNILILFLSFSLCLYAEGIEISDLRMIQINPTDSTEIGEIIPADTNYIFNENQLFSYKAKLRIKNNSEHKIMNFRFRLNSINFKTYDGQAFYEEIDKQFVRDFKYDDDKIRLFDSDNNELEQTTIDTLKCLWPGMSLEYTSPEIVNNNEPKEELDLAKIYRFSIISYYNKSDIILYKSTKEIIYNYEQLVDINEVKPTVVLDFYEYIYPEEAFNGYRPYFLFYDTEGVEIVDGNEAYQTSKIFNDPEYLPFDNGLPFWTDIFPIKSPILKLNRVDFKGMEYKDQTGDILLFPIMDVSSNSLVTIAFRYQRTGKALSDYELGWCDNLMIGPEHRVVSASDSSVIRQGDMLTVDIATASDPMELINIDEDRWNNHQIEELNVSGNPALTIFGGGGYSLAFPINNPMDIKDFESGMHIDFSDHGKDQSYINAVIQLPDQIFGSQDKYIRIRLRVVAQKDDEYADDTDDFYIDDFKVYDGSAHPIASIISVNSDDLYTITHDKTFNLDLSAKIICKRDLPQISVTAKVKRKTDANWPEQPNSDMVNTVTANNIGAYQEAVVDLSGIVLNLSEDNFQNHFDIMVTTEYLGNALVLSDTLYDEFSIAYGQSYAYHHPEHVSNEIDDYYLGDGLKLPIYPDTEGGRDVEIGNYKDFVEGQMAVFFELTKTDTLKGYQTLTSTFGVKSLDLNYFSVYTHNEDTNLPGELINESFLQARKVWDEKRDEIITDEFSSVYLTDLCVLEPGKYWMVLAQLDENTLLLGASAYRTGQVAMAIDDDNDDTEDNSVYVNIYDNFRYDDATSLKNKNLWAYENFMNSGDWQPFIPTRGQPAFAHLNYLGDVNNYRSYSRGVWMPLMKPIFEDITYSGVIEGDFSNDIIIYPNPASIFLSINFSQKSSGNVRITILNMLGEKIKSIHNGFLTEGQYDIKAVISDLPSGVYMINKETGEKVETMKFIKY